MVKLPMWYLRHDLVCGDWGSPNQACTSVTYSLTINVQTGGKAVAFDIIQGDFPVRVRNDYHSDEGADALRAVATAKSQLGIIVGRG